MEKVSIPDKYLQGLQRKIKKALFTTAEKKTIDGQKVFVVSDETVDREGETISVDGWKLDNYKNYPVLLWAHNALEPLIGHGTSLRYRTINGKKRLTFVPKFHRKDERSRLLSDLVDEDWVRGVSVGFLPIEQEDDRHTKQELLEISLVNVPSNPNALQAVYAKGHDKDLVSKVLKKIRAWKYHICKKCGFSRKTREAATYKTMDCPSCGKGLTKSMKDIKPVALKPYPNEHACRLKEPAGFQDGSFRRVSRKHDGKEYDVIMGRLKGERTMTEQAYRYPKGTWQPSEARSHCKAHDGIEFSPASKSLKELREEAEKKMEKIKLEKKGVIPFKSYPKAPETSDWEAGKEVKASEISDLKMMCTWFDSSKPEIKSSYKLPHHRKAGYTTVWRGVAAAMAALLGARGGVDLPSGDRKGVYNHLKRHYAEFDKEAPEFRSYTKSELEKLFPTKKKPKKVKLPKDTTKEMKVFKKSIDRLAEGLSKDREETKDINKEFKSKMATKMKDATKKMKETTGAVEETADKVSKLVKGIKGSLEKELTTISGGAEKSREELKTENKKFKSRVSRRIKDISKGMEALAGVVTKTATKTDKFIKGIEKRDEVIELNNKKVNKEFKKIKLDIKKGIDSDKLDTKLDDIQENIQSLAEGLKSFTSARESGSKQKGDDAKKRNRLVAHKALNQLTEVLNKNKE